MTILVSGATGSVGRMVVDELLALGADDVRALTIDPSRAALPASVQVVRGNIAKPASVRSALHGVDRMYLAPRVDTAAIVSEMAAEAGVRHIVDLANAPIAMEDIAAVAARILVDGGHQGRAYELTGPESLTRREKVRLIGMALGRELTYVDLPRDLAVEQFAQVMGEYAAWYGDGLQVLAEHPQAAVTTVSSLLGRSATTFLEWARAHAALFR